MRFFSKKTDYQKQLESLEKTKDELTRTVDESIKIAEIDINETRKFYEIMKNHGIRRFDNLLNLCLYSAVTNIDLIPLSERIRLTERRLEKVLFARMLAMIIIEYLKDINDLLGFKLIGELNSNKYSEFVPEIKKINSEFADIRKKHEKILMVIRNNISAHKTKESLNLIHYIFNLDTDEICSLAIATININTLLTSATTKIYHIILKEAENNKSQANR